MKGGSDTLCDFFGKMKVLHCNERPNKFQPLGVLDTVLPVLLQIWSRDDVERFQRGKGIEGKAKKPSETWEMTFWLIG